MTKKFFTNISVILTFVFFLPLLQNCSEQPEAPSKNETPNETPAQKFNLGLIPEQDLFSQKERYEPLARYISEKAGLKSKFFRVMATSLTISFLASWTVPFSVVLLGHWQSRKLGLFHLLGLYGLMAPQLTMV